MAAMQVVQLGSGQHTQQDWQPADMPGLAPGVGKSRYGLGDPSQGVPVRPGDRNRRAPLVAGLGCRRASEWGRSSVLPGVQSGLWTLRGTRLGYVVHTSV